MDTIKQSLGPMPLLAKEGVIKISNDLGGRSSEITNYIILGITLILGYLLQNLSKPNGGSRFSRLTPQAKMRPTRAQGAPLSPPPPS